MPTHYEILGVPPDASERAIRSAFRTLAKARHPDRVSSGANAAMVRLNQAYDVLRDPVRRRAYDRDIAAPLSLGQRPAPAVPRRGVDPYDFLAGVFGPLDRTLGAAIARLEAAVEQLAYDLYDDRELARFAESLEAADDAVAGVSARLFGSEWPDPWLSALNLYGQGLRQLEDAIGDFETFLGNFDADALVGGRSLVIIARDMLAEARTAIGLG